MRITTESGDARQYEGSSSSVHVVAPGLVHRVPVGHALVPFPSRYLPASTTQSSSLVDPFPSVRG